MLTGLVVGVMAFSWPSPAGAADSMCQDGKAVSESMAKQGPARVIQGRSDSEAGWNRLLSCIRTGDSAWLQIASQIQGQLDGGGPGELAMAVGDALERNAIGVLSLIRRGYSSTKVVCACVGFEDLLGDDFNQALATIDRRRKSVEAVVSHGVATERSSCLTHLAALEADVRKHEHEWFAQ